MKRLSSNAKRVPRKIGHVDDESSADGSEGGAQKVQAASVVKRPVFGKSKKRSSLRLSFGPGDSSANDGDESSDAAVVTPKRTNLSRIAMERNAERKPRSSLLNELPRPRENIDEDRPSYSKDYIAALRNSTPSTPKDLGTGNEEDSTKALDITSKFGPLAKLSAERPSAIPSAAEIREKKARRARLAQEKTSHDTLGGDEDDNWASDDDDEFRTSRNEISLRPKEKYAETRLVREDEDIAEGFDEYVEDEHITLGRKAEREAQRKRRAEMADLIADAEKDSDSEESDSEAERNAAYEAAQTRAGTYGRQEQRMDDGAKTPPRITPLPELSEVMERLQAEVRSREQRKDAVLKQLEDIKEEKARIAESKKYVQEQLQKAGEEYEKLRIESGMAALPMNGGEGGKLIVNRGLDSLGATPLPTSREESSDE
ncbi:nineteen complex-related protein 2-domain-containing protein [Clohesyomyces aquaticus]|uniref:Nineteen complex-related protein 2-domain-containing protein n=1 Tax=Clohesyomyces aquaticus TaxID=1231657 RepID=A0A1Y2AAA1_9PLEO|nr:nineteen complex-related protein 2-domain-containing protein [Clohesyomyces aquaticus]